MGEEASVPETPELDGVDRPACVFGGDEDGDEFDEAGELAADELPVDVCGEDMLDAGLGICVCALGACRCCE